MMTPRSVAMGNKVYKMHVKHGSNKETVLLAPDSTICQLKEKIHSTFQVPPENQSLLCNGKYLDLDESVSLKQARIPNGSKILLQNIWETKSKTSTLNCGNSGGVTSCQTGKPEDIGECGESLYTDSDITQSNVNVDFSKDSPDQSNNQQDSSTSREACRGSELDFILQIELRGLDLQKTLRSLGQEIAELTGKSTQGSVEEMKRIKKESGIHGELIMKDLEYLDQVRFTEEMVEARSNRKRVANLLNLVLDLNDENIQALQAAISRNAKVT